ncbi:DUF3592 domain-containing protein [Candidatus Aalborgicola defluviihabitans]|uniref:DUF3592 domain-containing protein n=2 Tax=Candidatus Aalborgicola defluviihabitans TaxID=3386187 RepID=UPI00390C1A68|nr:hypothetical protein [Burkholderiales bacterium]
MQPKWRAWKSGFFTASLKGMDYRLWFAAIGFASVLAMWGFHRFGRTKANEHLQARGVLVEGEVLKCNVQGSRFIWTEITFTYAPEGGQPPVTVTRKLDGRVLLEAGQRVPVRYLRSHPKVSILVGYEKRHDAC